MIDAIDAGGGSMSLRTAVVARKQKGPAGTDPGPEKKPKGRPKGAGRITLRYAIVTTPEYRTWMEDFMAHLGEPEVSDVIREAIRSYAEMKGFRTPPKR
jgi:hypothetical protein